MREDLRYGVRMLLKHPLFTVVAVLSLSVGIGATTTVFSIANGILLKPLPVEGADRLVTLNKPRPEGSAIHVVSYPDFREIRALDVFQDVIGWAENSVSIEIGGEPEQVHAINISGDYFQTLGTRPALGRLLTPEDDVTPGAHPVAVLSHPYWQSRFGSDSTVVGERLALNGQSYTIVGVTPRGFTSTYGAFAPAIYVPLVMQPSLRGQPTMHDNRNSSNIKISARLADGVSREQAQAAASLLDAQIERANPEVGPTSKVMGLGVELVPIGEYPWDIQVALYGLAALLVAIVGCVLLIACANVAGMLMARATVRRREVAVRLALGASRGRLVRQLLTESSLLFAAAGLLGVGLTAWLTRILAAIPIPVAVPIALDAAVDWRVLGFTLVLALGTGLVFGLAPALEAAGADLHSALKDAPASGGFKRSRLRQAFVVAQIALSLFLLIGAGLFERALGYGRTVFPGRDPETVLTGSLDPRSLGYDGRRSRALYRQLSERAAAIPGVEGVSMARSLQIGGGNSNTSVVVEDARDAGAQYVEVNNVTPGYFSTLGVRLIEGRDFTWQDRDGAPFVVIVNEAMVRKYWPGTSPLGRRVQLDESRWAEVIGVAEDGRHRVAGEASPPFIYRPYYQGESDESITILLRFRGERTDVVTALRGEVRALDPSLALQSPMTLLGAVEVVTLPWRIAGALARGLGILGLLLATLGIYGLVSYTVSQRTQEFGVRLALGATSRDIQRLVLGNGARLALVGVAVGLALSFLLTQALSAFLFGVSASDPRTFLGQSALLAGAALLASYLPARRATRTDPLVALRHE